MPHVRTLLAVQSQLSGPQTLDACSFVPRCVCIRIRIHIHIHLWSRHSGCSTCHSGLDTSPNASRHAGARATRVIASQSTPWLPRLCFGCCSSARHGATRRRLRAAAAATCTLPGHHAASEMEPLTRPLQAVPRCPAARQQQKWPALLLACITSRSSKPCRCCTRFC